MKISYLPTFLSISLTIFVYKTPASQASEFRLWGTIDGVGFKYQNPSSLKYFLDFSMIGFPKNFTEEDKKEAKSNAEKAIDLAFKQWTDATKDTQGSKTNVPNVPVMSLKSDEVAGRKVRELTDSEINGLKQLYGDNFDVNYMKIQKLEEANVVVKFIDKLPDTAAESDVGFWDSGQLQQGQKYSDVRHTIYLENLPNEDQWLYTVDSNKDGVINNSDSYPIGSQDLYTTIKHEIGHDLGFDHPPDEKSGRGCPGSCVITTPEPTSTLGLLALGTLGAGLTIKRKLKPSKQTTKELEKKELEKVG